MTNINKSDVSPLRLRIGVIMIVIWWAPIWLLSPFISDYLNGTPSTATITTAIVVIQTLIGLLGFYVAGKEVVGIIKNKPKKQALKTIWYVLIHGQVEKQL